MALCNKQCRKFYRLITAPEEEILLVPDRFIRDGFGPTPAKVIWVTDDHKTWEVRLMKLDGSIYFFQGWPEFRLAYNLKPYSMLTFEYDGGIRLLVSVFDPDGVQLNFERQGRFAGDDAWPRMQMPNIGISIQTDEQKAILASLLSNRKEKKDTKSKAIATSDSSEKSSASSDDDPGQLNHTASDLTNKRGRFLRGESSSGIRTPAMHNSSPPSDRGKSFSAGSIRPLNSHVNLDRTLSTRKGQMLPPRQRSLSIGGDRRSPLSSSVHSTEELNPIPRPAYGHGKMDAYAAASGCGFQMGESSSASRPIGINRPDGIVVGHCVVAIPQIAAGGILHLAWQDIPLDFAASNLNRGLSERLLVVSDGREFPVSVVLGIEDAYISFGWHVVIEELNLKEGDSCIIVQSTNDKNKWELTPVYGGLR